MTRTVKVEDREYTIGTMNFGEGREIFKPEVDPFDSNCEMVARCLMHGTAGTTYTADNVKELPYPDGQALVLACLDINGLRKAKPGEDPAATATA